MIHWFASFFLVFAFIIIIKWLRIPEISKDVIKTANKSVLVIFDQEQTDEEKEKQLQLNAKLLFKQFFKIIFAGGIAVITPFSFVWLLSKSNLISLEKIITISTSPGFLITGFIIALIAFLPFFRKSKETDKYSELDKLLHQIAFASFASHVSISEFENYIFLKNKEKPEKENPVFITGLPRSGTTFLLECCSQCSEFATHCYRDMPFVITPIFWSYFVAIFGRKSSGKQERAHGDGMLIDYDSPEAFEEILWKTFWKHHYKHDFINPWKIEENQDFSTFKQFFVNHMQKIKFLRRGKRTNLSATRYISKNNGNIARITFLRKLFPESIILVPFREPVSHSASLLKQHLNFLSIHKSDPFAEEYMKAIGHFDFGNNLKPINFNNWFEKFAVEQAVEPEFWLQYWIACYKYNLQLARDNNLLFFNYDKLCQKPEDSLQLLKNALKIKQEDFVTINLEKVHKATAKEINRSDFSKDSITKSENLLERLAEIAVN